METQKIIAELQKKAEQGESRLMKRIVSDLKRPSRIRREVNLSRLDRYTKEGEIIIVPGKLLGGGEINHKVTVYAHGFSSSAIDKLKRSGSTAIQMKDLNKENIDGKKVRIIG